MGSKFWLYAVVVVALVVYFMSGFFQVNPSEVALIKTFGKFSRMVGPGFHVRAPFPFQTHVKVDVQTIRKEEIGFRTVGERKYESDELEALMLTSDGNIVSVEAVVSYRVTDPIKFAFNIRQPADLVKFTAESVLRDRISKRTVDEILTSERENVASEVLVTTQKLLDSYDSGVQIVNLLLQEVVPPKEVVAAFDDVNNAKQDKERYVNEAAKYANNLIPKVEGEALKIVLEAQSYAEQQVLRARGEAQRYLAVLDEYRKAPEVTRTRLRISVLQEVLPKAKRILVLDSSGKLTVLNLSELLGGEQR